MRIKVCTIILAAAMYFAFVSDATRAATQAGDTPHVVPAKERIAAYAFDLADVKLLEGPFKHAQELDRKYLLSLEPDRLLHCFRQTAGLPTGDARPYEGRDSWERANCELRGHFAGHYLTACALMVRATGDRQLLENANKVVAGMAECQAKIGTGYLSAYPEEQIDRVIAGRRVWAPWYTLHKIYDGLLDMYRLTGNAQALEVVKKYGDWCYGRLGKLSDEQIQVMLGNEHGGMNDSMAVLHGLTGDRKYLELAERCFYHKKILDPLSRREDPLDNVHANTQFPKVIGCARLFELTGNQKYQIISRYFWDVVTGERSYVTGGNSDNEGFSTKSELSKHIGPNSTETCNEYNMLKLTRHLFCWRPEARYADYYERTLYNQILSSQHPETGMMLYYQPLKTGLPKEGPGVRGFNKPFESFWCCTGTGVENHAKYGDSIYFHDGKDTLWVNLFIASELNWKEKGVKVRQETNYPEEEATKLIFECKEPTELTINIRRPWWVRKDWIVYQNGGHWKGVQGREYLKLTGTIKTGDTIRIGMPMSIYTEGFKDKPNKLALMYGPLVLCAQTEQGNELAAIRTSRSALRADESGHRPDLHLQIKPVPGKTLTFEGPRSVFRTAIEKQEGAVTFVPLYREFTHPYAVYWDVMDDAAWAAMEKEKAEQLARERELAARTVDVVVPGSGATQYRKLAQQNSGAGRFGGRTWRHATDGGWFAFEMKSLPDQPLELCCTYWGSDGGRREFDVLVDGKKIATQKLQNNRPGKFYDEIYAIPPELTKGKEKIAVKFVARPGMTAGGVFECRVLRK